MQLFKNNQIKLGDKLLETLVQIDNLCEHLSRLESDGKIQSADVAFALDAFTNLHALKTRLKENVAILDEVFDGSYSMTNRDKFI